MLNYYKESKNQFRKYIKQNPFCTREEWDNYANKFCLFSSFTLESHEIETELLNKLCRENIDTFEFLKELFVIIPNKRILNINKIIKINKRKKQEIKENGR